MRDTMDMAREADLVYWLPNPTYTDGRWWMDAGEPGYELKAFEALVRADERDRMCEQLKECLSEKSTSNEANRSAVLGEGRQAN